MNEVLALLAGAVLCAIFLFAYMRIHEWADDKGTFTARIVSRVLLVLVSASITLVGFGAVGLVCSYILQSLFGTS